MFDEYYDEDSRSIFINKICKLLVIKNNGDIDAAVLDFADINGDIHENIRNVYELISHEIPLMALYDLKRYDANNYGITDKEYKNALKKTYEACIDFYTGE